MSNHLFSASNRDFRSFVDHCSQAERLTIFVGAGSSAEIGIPTWEPVLEEMLKQAFSIPSGRRLLADLGMEEVPTAWQEIWRATRGDPARLATIIELVTGETSFIPVLRVALYSALPSVELGPTALQIASLYRARLERGLVTTLLTTNYDESLAAALTAVGLNHSGMSIESLSGDLDLAPDSQGEPVDTDHRPRIFHLHGYVPFGGSEVLDPVILGEATYAVHGIQSAQIIASHLERSTCLFVGLSLTDIDLVSAAYQVAHGGDPGEDALHFALITEDISIPPLTRHLFRARLQRLRIHTLAELCSFAQVPQALFEVRQRLQSDEAYWTGKDRYGKRLGAWAADFARAYPDGDEDSVETTQDRVGKWLRRELDAIKKDFRLQGVNDLLALHVWVRSSDEYRLYLWASTEYSGRQPSHRNYDSQIAGDSRFLAVRQAYYGVPTRRMETIEGSRWRQAMSVPIITSEGDGARGRLLIGVINFSTGSDRQTSQLARVLTTDGVIYPRLVQRLAAVGGALIAGLEAT